MTSQQGDGGPGQRRKAGPFRAIAHHQQRKAQAVEGFHHEINPFVGNQPAEAEVSVVTVRIPAEAIHSHRWMQHVRLASPELADAPGREAGIGHQVIHPLRTELIPLTQGMQLPADQGTEAAAGQG